MPDAAAADSKAAVVVARLRWGITSRQGRLGKGRRDTGAGAMAGQLDVRQGEGCGTRSRETEVEDGGEIRMDMDRSWIGPNKGRAGQGRTQTIPTWEKIKLIK